MLQRYRLHRRESLPYQVPLSGGHGLILDPLDLFGGEKRYPSIEHCPDAGVLWGIIIPAAEKKIISLRYAGK
ncbi:hypothetical protein DESC_160033 [Desulfosarcina cetonica]|nr:hypothetical protein DESC_160033 [Desulfosarcina cetonica]